MNNIRKYWTILYNIAQYWTIFDYIWKYLTISSNIASHLIPQKQTYAIPKFSIKFFFFTCASSRGAVVPKKKVNEFPYENSQPPVKWAKRSPKETLCCKYYLEIFGWDEYQCFTIDSVCAACIYVWTRKYYL